MLLKTPLLEEIINHKAYVNIMYGCDKFCTYEFHIQEENKRSRKVEDILCEVNNLVKDGYKEVTLLAKC